MRTREDNISTEREVSARQGNNKTRSDCKQNDIAGKELAEALGMSKLTF
jgi:hypothetical protein